jgi:hypothetical protein
MPIYRWSLTHLTEKIGFKPRPSRTAFLQNSYYHPSRILNKRKSIYSGSRYNNGFMLNLTYEYKLIYRIAKHHEYIKNSRSYFHFKVAHELCDRAGMIFASDLNLKAMSAWMLGGQVV